VGWGRCQRQEEEARPPRPNPSPDLIPTAEGALIPVYGEGALEAKGEGKGKGGRGRDTACTSDTHEKQRHQQHFFARVGLPILHACICNPLGLQPAFEVEWFYGRGNSSSRRRCAKKANAASPHACGLMQLRTPLHPGPYPCPSGKVPFAIRPSPFVLIR
jgi:hypothetical protein